MAQFTFVTAMSVQACLHVGYRNEPNKIEKGQLCQKLTYGQQPTGGGRVLSVILAGTLAMGMTPAVALTTQTVAPIQAFATDTAIGITTLVATYVSNGTSTLTGFDSNGYSYNPAGLTFTVPTLAGVNADTPEYKASEGSLTIKQGETTFNPNSSGAYVLDKGTYTAQISYPSTSLNTSIIVSIYPS